MQFFEHIVIGDREEVEAFVREPDFSYRNGSNELNLLYDGLSCEYQKLISDTMRILAGDEEQEHIGYNFIQIKEWFKLSDPSDADSPRSGASAYKVLQEIAKHADMLDLSDDIIKPIKEGADDMEADYIAGTNFEWLQNYFDKLTKKSHLKETKNSISIEDREEIINIFCEYLMVSPDLLYKGMGEIHIVDTDFLESRQFDELVDANDDLLKNTRSTYDFFSYCQELIGDEYQIMETRYAKIRHSGIYALLKNINRGRGARAIENMIEELAEITEDEFISY